MTHVNTKKRRRKHVLRHKVAFPPVLYEIMASWYHGMTMNAFCEYHSKKAGVNYDCIRKPIKKQGQMQAYEETVAKLWDHFGKMGMMTEDSGSAE